MYKKNNIDERERLNTALSEGRYWLDQGKALICHRNMQLLHYLHVLTIQLGRNGD